MNFRNRSGHFLKSTGFMGGFKCPKCSCLVRMGPVDEHRCLRTKVCISIGRDELRRIDELADAAGMKRSEFLRMCALERGAKP